MVKEYYGSMIAYIIVFSHMKMGSTNLCQNVRETKNWKNLHHLHLHFRKALEIIMWIFNCLSMMMCMCASVDIYTIITSPLRLARICFFFFFFSRFNLTAGKRHRKKKRFQFFCLSVKEMSIKYRRWTNLGSYNRNK